MGKISEAEILKLAKLANLSIDSEDVEKYRAEIESILEYLDILDSEDVSDFSPTYQVADLENVQRGDKEIDYGVSRDALLEGLPHRAEDYIKVQRMLS